MEPFNLDELLKKDKAELDRIKAAVEIYQSENKYAFEKRKLRTENLRFILIAVTTSAISLGSAYVIEKFKQSNNSKADNKKEFSELTNTYLKETDKTRRNEIACVIADFDNPFKDPHILKAQEKYRVICDAVSNIQQQAGIISNVDTMKVEVKQAIVKIDSLDKQLQNLQQQQKVADPSEKIKINRQIETANRQVNSVLKDVPAIQPAIASTEDIEKNVKKIQSENNILMLQQPPTGVSSTKEPVAWFKEGYFLLFHGYRITLKRLDKREGIHVDICNTKGSGNCDVSIRTDAPVKYGVPLEFSDNGKLYRITLETIDHAGKNPFTLAAYITFETLNAAP